ncbi:MAG: hypothetical protein E7268_04560 [Lachnospiraceae bacterium]|nr:hypothetical protein [Lachnospiraceae bacterium]
MRSFSKKLAFVLAAAMVVTAFAPAAKAEAASEMAINKQDKILYVTDGKGINDAAQVGGGKGNVSVYDFSVKNKPADWKTAYSFAWSSSDEDVVTVGKGGVTTAVGVGKATVYCKVTNKATKEVTTLKTDVTVKANAAKVEIINADDWADLAYEVGDTIDLNRAMYDAAGVKTTKRGQYVTDYTKWVAEPATGVKIDSTKGTFTFTEEAEAGEYSFWCETYQSKKYTATTAKSDVVKVVLVKDNAFTATQDSLNQFTINFDSAVEALAKGDVTVQKIRVANEKEYYTKVTVKSVALNEAKDAATVVLFNSLEDGTNYKITVKGSEEAFVLSATAGYPVAMEVFAKNDQNKVLDVLTTGVDATLDAKFYDESGVDVTAKGYKATFSLVEYSKNGGYSLAGTTLKIKKAGEVVGVKAKCQKYENGKLVVNLEEVFYFTAEDEAPVYAVGVADFSVNGFDSNGNQQTIQVQDKNKELSVKVEYDNGSVSKNGVKANGALETKPVATTLSFTALDPSVCNITSNGILIPYKEGTAGFYVNTVTVQKNGTKVVEPFGEVYVEVKANSKFDHITIDKYDATVGVVEGYDTAEIKVTAYDQYGNKFAGADAITIEGVSDNAKIVTLGKSGSGAEQKILIDGSAIKTALSGNANFAIAAGDAAYLEFKVKIGNSEQYFSVVVQDKSANEDDYYFAVENNGKTDALRVVTNDGNTNTEDLKTLTFTVYQMSNNTKVGKIEFDAHPGNDLSAVSEGQYFFKLLKDGKEVAVDGNMVTTDGTSVSIKLSELSDAASGSAIGAGKKLVTYNTTGAGNYVFELYLSYANGDLTQVDVNSCYVTVGDKGAYTVASQEKNEIDMSDSFNHAIGNGYVADYKTALLKCFKFNGRDGKEVDLTAEGKMVDVKYDATVGTGSVYVESITVYEAVATNEYVAYEIPVNVVLVRK